jgi:hypothetical protein
MWQDQHSAILLLSVREALSELSWMNLQGFVMPLKQYFIADERKPWL